MATYTVRGKKVRAQVDMRGVYDSGTFPSKGAARAWATAREAEIIAGERGDIPDKTFGDLLTRYRDEVSPSKKGARFEVIRINRILGKLNLEKRTYTEGDPIASVALKDMDGKVVAQWRDRRLAAGLKPASVRREWNQLSSACTVAVGEWKWLKFNPFSKLNGVKRPSNSKHREERFFKPDLDELQAAANAHPTEVYRRVMRALYFGIETAMRSGEIIFLGNNPDRVDIASRVARLPDTKNGNARDVPLSAEAVRLWEEALADERQDGLGVWGLSDGSRDVHFRDLREIAAKRRKDVARLHFHDTRHTAVTALAKKLQPMELARMAGITDFKILMGYYNPSAADIALKL